MTTPQPRVIVPGNAAKGEVFPVKTIISHEMETGLRSDENGVVIPRKIINRFVCTYAGTVVFSVDLHEAVSANPFFEFFLVATETGRLGIHLGRRRRQGLFVVTRSGGQLRPRAERRDAWFRPGIARGNRLSVELLIAAGLVLLGARVRRSGATIRPFRSQPPAHRVMARPKASRQFPGLPVLTSRRSFVRCRLFEQAKRRAT